MPISKDEWDGGRTSDHLKSRIESYLQQNQSQAFTVGEIIDHLYQFKGEGWASFLLNLGSAFVVQNALKELIEEGKIKSKIIEKNVGSNEYYMIA